MAQDDMKSTLRKNIVEKSIQILRTHGRSENEIREMMLKDFAISESRPWQAILPSSGLVRPEQARV